MNELLSNLGLGLSVAFTAQNLLYCFIGCLLGTLVGVLPGIGPVATIAMLLPATFALSPVTSLIMLAGIYYGAQYGGSTTAILVNLPGETSSVVTAIDGYQMARQGRAGAALGIAALGSFFAGSVATLLLAAAAPSLAEIAFKFGPAEYFSLMVLGLIAAVVLASGSLLKAIAMILVGLLLGLIGTDVNSGMARYSFGLPELTDGIGFVAVAMGIFGFGEIIRNLESPEKREIFTAKVGSLLPTWSDIKQSIRPVLRGTTLGSFLGILPGGGPALAAFSAYSLEKKLSKAPERFGKGAIEGVAGPESANNAAAQTSFIPLLTLGIPSNPVMALMIGAMIIQGIQPGPQVMKDKPDLFWGMIASMWVGNLMLVILNLPLIGIWIKLLTISYRFLYPAILIFCCIGAYSINNAWFDVIITAGFGILGYIFIKLDCEPAPLLLGFVLGPMMEENLRRALLLSRGDPMVFFERPLSLTLLAIAGVLLLLVMAPAVKKPGCYTCGRFGPRFDA
jgi:putative tricarboxylic transport membrane protein